MNRLPSVHLKKTSNLRDKQKRIDKLPQYAADSIRLMTKSKARGFIIYWQGMLRTDAYMLRRLKPATVRAKERAGYSRPMTPLYGLGDDDTHTYINMMRLYKLKNGYKVAPGRKGHHKSKLKLRDLFVVHEFGCTITNGFGLGIYIRIPPRPTFYFAYEAYMRKTAKKSGSREVMKAAKQFVNTGHTDLFRRIRKRYGGHDREGD